VSFASLSRNIPFAIVPPQLSETSRSEALEPANPCVLSVTHPDLHVQSVQSRVTPGYAPLS
jgi:hypothetical protein